MQATRPIRAILLALSASDAGDVDEDFAVGVAVNRIRMAIVRAMWLLAVTARRRHVELLIPATGPSGIDFSDRLPSP